MTTHICKILILSLARKNTLHPYKPHYSSSISFTFFSSRPTRSGKPSTAVADFLVKNHQFSPEAALKASSVVTYLKNPKSTDSILSFLKEIGFSQTHVERVVKSAPVVLSASLDRTIKPKIKIFQDLGLLPVDVAKIIATDPWILMRSADNRLGPSIMALKSVMGSDLEVCKVLKVTGWFLKYDLEKTMLPNIEFMKSCGISAVQIKKLVFNFPRFFLHKPESIRDFVKRVDEMGFDRKSKMYLHAIRVVSSMTIETWELKLQLFQSLGFLEKDIAAAFQRVPQVFAVSERKLKEATQLLLSSRDLDISYVASHPELLICSVEQRLKPRLRVLEILERKNLLPKRPSLTTACKISNTKFYGRYVLPYSIEAFWTVEAS